MFTRLLVPLDRSPLAEQALGQAAAIARAAGAEIDLVLVHQPFPFNGFSDVPWNTELWMDGRRYLETVAAELSASASVPVTHAIVKGEPVDMICRRVADVRADLVVMTSHGRTGLSRAWLGSVADGVLRHSAVPVLVLRPVEPTTRDVAAHRPFRRMLVPVDGSPLAAEVLPAAAALAKCGETRISLLQVVPPPPMISAEAGMPYVFIPALVDDDSTRHLAEEVRGDLMDVGRRLHGETGLHVDVHVMVEDHPAPAILDFVHEHEIDVIAMSTHGRGMSRFLLGSVADKVLRGSEVPMLVYRPLGVRTRPAEKPTADSASPSATHA